MPLFWRGPPPPTPGVDQWVNIRPQSLCWGPSEARREAPAQVRHHAPEAAAYAPAPRSEGRRGGDCGGGEGSDGPGASDRFFHAWHGGLFSFLVLWFCSFLLVAAKSNALCSPATDWTVWVCVFLRVPMPSSSVWLKGKSTRMGRLMLTQSHFT